MMRSLKEKFWEKVKKTDVCWLWCGNKNSQGYGRFHPHRKKAYRSHRMAWVLTNGDIPNGLCVLHNCPGGDNPACVNPSHLWLGTIGDNNRDRDIKGRAACGNKNGARLYPERLTRGENQSSAKLTSEDVWHARDLRSCWGLSHQAIARKLGVSKSTIRLLLTGKTWIHLRYWWEGTDIEKDL